MVSRRAAIRALAAGVFGAGCQALPPSRRARSLNLDELAERYVRLTLRLAMHQPSLVEAWRGPDEWRTQMREPVKTIRQGIVEVHAAVSDVRDEGADDERFRYLQAQLAALAIAARRLAGETMPFLAEASAALGLDPGHIDLHEAAVAAARDELERSVPGRGPLHDRYVAFRRSQMVAPERVLETFRSAIAACRDRVRRQIALPESEAVESAAADAGDLEAAATYDGGFRTRATLGAAGPMDLAHLVWLAAHESYPGHHLQHVLADRDCVRGRGWRERELFPNFGRHQFHAEGCAEAGADLLLEGDAFVEVCRSLAPVAGVPAGDIAPGVAVHRAHMALDGIVPSIARAYLDGELGTEAAIERLRETALVPEPAGLLIAIEKRRTRILSYPVGRRIVSADLMAVPAGQRWERLGRWATTLVPPRSGR